MVLDNFHPVDVLKGSPMQKSAQRSPAFVLITLCLVVCGCQSIPTEQLRMFLAQFVAAKDESF